jgi:hypothetical protein
MLVTTGLWKGNTVEMVEIDHRVTFDGCVAWLVVARLDAMGVARVIINMFTITSWDQFVTIFCTLQLTMLVFPWCYLTRWAQ